MGIGRSSPVKNYYDIKPKDILFPEDEDDSDLDDLPHDLEHLEVRMCNRPSKFCIVQCSECCDIVYLHMFNG